MYFFRKLNFLNFILIAVIFSNRRAVHSRSLLLTSYLPASMQALAYYIDLLQYEPLATTTIQPPFNADGSSDGFNASTATTTTTTSTTLRPSAQTTTVWWKPPHWWNQHSTTTTTTKRPISIPTQPHRPGIFAPLQSPNVRQTNKNPEGLELFEELGIGETEGFDSFSLALISDIQNEMNHDEFTNDVESLDNFLRLYDDNYGRATYDTAVDRWSASTSPTGKKRVPPTKPYVEFLLVYDLLKRDAKAANLSKYEGYSEELLRDLYELSHISAERQLYTLFKRMLDRGDISRSDVVSRVQGIMKDLGNPNSLTSKSLRYIPPMMFLP